jgi:hypothetical protein
MPTRIVETAIFVQFCLLRIVILPSVMFFSQ